MVFFLTVGFFSLFIYLVIRLISYCVNKYSSKRINEIDIIDTFAASLTSSLGYLIYSIIHGDNEVIATMTFEGLL
jgi:hypothetical protein